jgi:hypothetical protein
MYFMMNLLIHICGPAFLLAITFLFLSFYLVFFLTLFFLVLKSKHLKVELVWFSNVWKHHRSNGYCWIHVVFLMAGTFPPFRERLQLFVTTCKGVNTSLTNDLTFTSKNQNQNKMHFVQIFAPMSTFELYTLGLKASSMASLK